MDRVQEILSDYQADSPATLRNLSLLLRHGALGGTGKLVILPVDQGFEHGPDRSFAINPDAYDPMYHFRMAHDLGLSAFAAPLGMLELGAVEYAGRLPLILKLNSSNSWATRQDQSTTADVREALRMGCVGVGFTIYPGGEDALEMIEEAAEVTREAKELGLISVVWAYPRGPEVSKDGETSLDVTAYGAHMACLIGAHVIKVKLPTAHLEQKEAKAAITKANMTTEPLAERVRHIMCASFAGKRIVVFSGGAAKGVDDVLNDVRAIHDGGGNGCILGRNAFQRPYDEAKDLLNNILSIMKGA